MDITLRARNCDISTKVKDEARRKVEHATRIFDRIIDLEVSFSEEPNPRIPDPASVEITARSKGHTVRAVGAGADHHEAIDQAIDRLERQLRRYKTRLVDRGRRGRGEHVVALDTSPPDVGVQTGESEAEPVIVRRKQHPLTAMTPEDAVLQLELLGHDFYLFTNAETGDPNVVYHRDGGDVGLIEGTAAAPVMAG